TGGLTLLSIVAYSLLSTKSLPLIIIGVFILGFFLSTYETTMPGSLPTMFYTHIRYRTLSVTFNVSVSLFGGTTPLIASWLVESTGNALAPAYYLTAISLIGFLVITLFHASTAGKSLKGSYPNVDNEEDRKYYE
ncbi:MFS transporter, partial [Staphylococcus aureus]|nr:MFS transporter [Staphylococcus aureus]